MYEEYTLYTKLINMSVNYTYMSYTHDTWSLELEHRYVVNIYIHDQTQKTL